MVILSPLSPKLVLQIPSTFFVTTLGSTTLLPHLLFLHTRHPTATTPSRSDNLSLAAITSGRKLAILTPRATASELAEQLSSSYLVFPQMLSRPWAVGLRTLSFAIGGHSKILPHSTPKMSVATLVITPEPSHLILLDLYLTPSHRLIWGLAAGDASAGRFLGVHPSASPSALRPGGSTLYPWWAGSSTHPNLTAKLILLTY